MPPKGSKKAKPVAEKEPVAEEEPAVKGRAKAAPKAKAEPRGKRGAKGKKGDVEDGGGDNEDERMVEDERVVEDVMEISEEAKSSIEPTAAAAAASEVSIHSKTSRSDVDEGHRNSRNYGNNDNNNNDAMMVTDDHVDTADTADLRTGTATHSAPLMAITAYDLESRPPRPNGRLSDMSAPTIQLSGHEGPVYSISFDNTGRYLASASFDRDIFLWDITANSDGAVGGEGLAKANYNVLSGHKNAVLEVHWVFHHQPGGVSSSSSGTLLSCSADKTVALWDANKGLKIRKYVDHTNIVNSCAYARNAIDIMCSGGDDNFALVYDAREKSCVSSVQHDYQLTAVCMSPDGQTLFSGGIDNIVRSFDLRNASRGPVETLIMPGHNDSITGLCVSPDGSKLLSNAMDSTLRQWDITPFVRTDLTSRCTHLYQGIHHGAERNLLKCCYSRDSEYVSCGSSDRMVHVFDASTSKLVYYLPGHKGSVNQVIFHPHDQVIASCSTDRTIFIGELQ